MIGLGSNRLTVCRRGGMSVTQAGKGGMEWLAGVRMPSWSSPYSAQATAALKAQFPTQWATIRDYGFAHPEIVGYMNAYAPEDAKIAYSLVEGIGTRFLVGDGNAWITTKVVPNSKMYVRSKIKFLNAATSWQFPLNCNMRNSDGAQSFGVGKRNGYLYLNYNGDNQTSTRWVEGTTYDFIFQTDNANQYLYDGDTELKHTTKTAYLNTTVGIGLFYCNSKDGGVTWKTQAAIDGFYAEKDDVLVSHMIPILSASKNGMIDLVTGEYFPNEGTSPFTELIESPA